MLNDTSRMLAIRKTHSDIIHANQCATTVIPAPYTTNGTDPVYGVNWGVLKPVFLSGEYMREEGPTQVPGQHTTMQVFVDSTLNFMCTDRRRNFLLSKVS